MINMKSVKNKACYAFKFIILIFLVFATNFSAQAQPKDTLRVLFVGNSYTYFWNLPQTVSAMAASQGQVLIIRKSTAGGAYLKWHWNGIRGLNTKGLIISKDWDYVVLQNESLSTIEKPKRFLKYGKKFIRLIKKQGAEPILYMTWARKYNPLMQKTITQMYKKLADETGAGLAPVGLVWKEVRNLRPNLDLFFPGGSHPSIVGTYLIACVFYETITGNRTSPLPARIITTDRNGEKLYLSILTGFNANFIQQAVDEFFNSKKG